MSVDIATLGIRVDSQGAITGLNTVESGLSRVTKAAAALGITLGAGALFSKMVRETIDAQYAMAQLEARVKSTGMAAGFTAPQLAAMASEMQGLTTYSDEAVMGAQSLLLTFTKIRGDTLPAATLAVANLATAMGGDLKGAALQVGKALQDPEQGLTALRRSGVSFTDAQSDVIKALFATGQQAEAQKLILKELEVEFGGAAAAARNTLGGALEGLKNSFGDLFEVSRDSSSGVVGAINAISGVLPALDAKIHAVFGGFRLMWVDLQVAIQKFNAFFYDSIGSIVGAFAKLLSYLPGTTDEVAAMTKAADALHLKAGILRDSFEAWRAEQEALITGTGKQTQAVRALNKEIAEQSELLKKLNNDIAEQEKLLRFNSTHADQLVRLNVLQEQNNRLTSNAADIAKRQIELLDKLNASIAIQFQMSLRMPKTGTALGASLGGGAGSAPGWSASPFNTTDLRTTAEIQRDNARAAARIKLEIETEKSIAAARKDIYENFLRGTQEAFAKTFEDIFSKGIKSFGDLFRSIGDLIKKAAAQWAASGLMNMLAGKKGEDGKMSGGLVSAHPVIAGVVALGASIIEMGARAKQAAKDVEAMAKALNLSLGQYRADAGLQPKEDTAIADAKARAEQLRADIRAKAEREIDAVNANMWTTRWHKERRAAEIWKAAQKELDKVSEAEKALIALREKQAAAIEAARAAEAAWNTARARDDLKVRDLTLRGLTDEAEAQALFNAQVREYAAAVAEVNRGLLSEEFLKELSAIQERERNALAASQAAAKAAEAERRLTEAREKAAAQLSAFQDLEVEMLQAKGQTAEAEQRAFELEQQRRLEEAQKNQTAEYVAKLKELQELQRANRAAAMAGGGAAAAVKAQQSTASNVFAGADTVTASFGTKVSAEVGDRMLDNLVSIRVILRAIEANTRNLGGKINTSLGLSLADNRNLLGSAVLS